MNRSKIRNLVHLALASAAIAIWPAQAIANTVTLECSYDGYEGVRAPFTVDIDKDRNAVTISHAAEAIGPGFQPASSEGPYPATITDQTYSWTQPATQYYGVINTVIDRVTGKAMESGSQAGVEFHTPWLCHAANRL